MNCCKKFIPVVATEDNDGHWYIIPKDLIDRFEKDLEESDEDDALEEWSEYMTGGDLNLVQLYILK